MINLARLPVLIEDKGCWDAHDTPFIRQIYAFTGIDLNDLDLIAQGLLYLLDGRTLYCLTWRAGGRSEI